MAQAKARILMAISMAVACLALLAGCSSQDAQQDAQAQNRQYMASVNTIMGTLNENMDDFTTAVKDGEVVSLDSQLTAVNQAVSDLEALQAPDAMKDIQTSYVNGAKELQTALSDYVKLYEDVKAPESGTFDYGTYDSRLAEVQQHYDEGIKALQDADSKAQNA